MENANIHAAESRLIPVSQVKEGFNYRRRYNADKMASLRESIKIQGLIQPVTVRKLDDGYQLIAGGRRFRAVVEEFGPQATIKAEVRTMTDAEATAAMLAENNEREDPSIIEDAEGASRMLGLCNGDREEAARRLGWTRNKMDRRLAVMNAIQAVRDAYLDDKILVGHVEILAALRKEVQERVIETMLKSDRKITVDELKAMAEQSLQSLEAAIFDRAECNGCQFNTGMQQAMFETSFSGTRCTNKECYQGKTEAELQIRAKALADTYQVVRIVRVGDNSTVTPLRAEGAKGVGDAQALACRTCADFGACVSAVPDKLGNVYKDVCFNKTCNDDKVAVQAKTLKEVQEGQSSEQQKAQPGSGQPQQQPAAGGAAAQAKVVPKTEPKVAASSEPRHGAQHRLVLLAPQRNLLPLVHHRAFLLPGDRVDAGAAATGQQHEAGEPGRWGTDTCRHGPIVHLRASTVPRPGQAGTQQKAPPRRGCVLQPVIGLVSCGFSSGRNDPARS